MTSPQRDSRGYDTHFYDEQSLALGSARKMLSYLFEHYRPASVVDAGCGVGSWLTAARELGVGEILGIDGHDVIRSGLLRVPRESFIEADLEQPFDIRARADLCISVEVAIPGQDGTHHGNLWWPSFWVDLFERNGYAPVDCMRAPFWDDSEVAWIYAQNAVLYYDRTRTDIRQSISTMPCIRPAGLPLVHPMLYGHYHYEFERGSVRSKLPQLGTALARAIGRRIGLRARSSEPQAFFARGECSTSDADA